MRRVVARLPQRVSTITLPWTVSYRFSTEAAFSDPDETKSMALHILLIEATANATKRGDDTSAFDEQMQATYSFASSTPDAATLEEAVEYCTKKVFSWGDWRSGLAVFTGLAAAGEAGNASPGALRIMAKATGHACCRSRAWTAALGLLEMVSSSSVAASDAQCTGNAIEHAIVCCGAAKRWSDALAAFSYGITHCKHPTPLTTTLAASNACFISREWLLGLAFLGAAMDNCEVDYGNETHRRSIDRAFRQSFLALKKRAPQTGLLLLEKLISLPDFPSELPDSLRGSVVTLLSASGSWYRALDLSAGDSALQIQVLCESGQWMKAIGLLSEECSPHAIDQVIRATGNWQVALQLAPAGLAYGVDKRSRMFGKDMAVRASLYQSLFSALHHVEDTADAFQVATALYSKYNWTATTLPGYLRLAIHCNRHGVALSIVDKVQTHQDALPSRFKLPMEARELAVQAACHANKWKLALVHLDAMLNCVAMSRDLAEGSAAFESECRWISSQGSDVEEYWDGWANEISSETIPVVAAVCEASGYLKKDWRNAECP